MRNLTKFGLSLLLISILALISYYKFVLNGREDGSSLPSFERECVNDLLASYCAFLSTDYPSTNDYLPIGIKRVSNLPEMVKMTQELSFHPTINGTFITSSILILWTPGPNNRTLLDANNLAMLYSRNIDVISSSSPLLRRSAIDSFQKPTMDPNRISSARREIRLLMDNDDVIIFFRTNDGEVIFEY